MTDSPRKLGSIMLFLTIRSSNFPMSIAANTPQSAPQDQLIQAEAPVNPKQSRGWLQRFLKEPLLHFLLIGALLFGLHAYVEAAQTSEHPDVISVSPQMIDRLSTTWQRQWRRQPTAQELQNLIAADVQEEVLYREALAMGLDQGDAIIRRWLVQKMDFLSRDMIPPLEPTDEEIQTFFQDHRADYVEPAQISFTHVFLDEDRRQGQAETEAAVLLRQLQTQAVDRAPSLGDRFMLNYDYTQLEPLEVRQYFGAAFADQLFQLEPGTWQGPIRSGYGVHLVRITDRQEERLPDLAQVYDSVKQALMDQQREGLNQAFYDQLMEQYTVEINDSVLAEAPDLEQVLEEKLKLRTASLSNGPGFNLSGS